MRLLRGPDSFACDLARQAAQAQHAAHSQATSSQHSGQQAGAYDAGGYGQGYGQAGQYKDSGYGQVGCAPGVALPYVRSPACDIARTLHLT